MILEEDMFESPVESEAKTSRSRSMMIVGATAVVFIIVIVIALYVSRQAGSEGVGWVEPLRAGSPEYDSYVQHVEIEQHEPEGAENLLQQVMVVARAALHNRGDRTLSQIEVKAIVFDAVGNQIAEQVAYPVPKVSPQLGPGKSMFVQVKVDTVPAGANPAAASIVLNGLRFKQSEP